MAAPRAKRVALYGETTDWTNPRWLDRGDDGVWTTTFDLGPGIYQTKALVDDVWTLDGTARTRSAGGHRNDLVIVDGTPEPFLFAPSAPWVVPLDRGGVRVLVGVRKPASAPLVRVREHEAWSPVAMSLAFEEDEHAFFVGHAPVSAATVTFDIGGHETSWSRPPAVERPPAWWPNTAIYGVFVDRFRPAEDRPGWESDPGKGRAAGGDLHGVRRSLDAIAALGFDTIYLTPVHVGASVHRYDVIDPTVVDPALGGEAAYAALVSAAAAREMRVIQDLSFAHAGRGFPPFEDVLVHGAASRFASWFRWANGTLVHYGKRTDAPLFDLHCPDVRVMVLEQVAAFARRGAKGLRVDMAAEVPLDLAAAIRQRFHALVPDGVVFGELVPQHAWRWNGVLDAATDFGFHEQLTKLVTEGADLEHVFATLDRLEHLRGADVHTRAVRFVSTHDHPRLATLSAHRGALARLPLAYALLATLPGVPMLLYGEEIGMRSDGAGLALEDVWPDRAPMPWSGTRRDTSLHATIGALFRLRRESEALRSGSLTIAFADARTIVYRRAAAGETIDVALSFDPEPKTIAVDDDELPRLLPLAGNATTEGTVVHLPAYGFCVARRERALGQAIAPPAARRNLALRDEDMKNGVPYASTRPSRFFFSVTERCNLRCAHCITHAPERTASGTARTMTRAVIDALRDDLGLADYFAFVHGGESLTAPILFDLLQAIRAARGREPYVAHVLSNGVLLSPAVGARLVEAGVSSISVSLDGASAHTNDAIRTGGRFDDVVRRLRELLAWRRGEKIDLRVGLSFVVLAQNLHEVGAFVDLAADLGVDWVKLEEGVPATEFAKRSLVACASPDARRTIDAAMARGRDAGLVMVDHTIERAIWRCRLDDEARTFLEADEHANRSAIHPCRVPWETICIEPNGDARVLDFFGPIVGNVLAQPLRDSWNAREAMEARLQSVRGRLCGAGPVTCLG